MRPGRPEDRAAFLRLLEKEALEGRRETMPGRWMESALRGFTWDASSRVEPDGQGGLQGAVLVTHRMYDIGTITRVEVAVATAGDGELRRRLTEWGLGFSRAGGAAGAQVWVPRGRGEADGAGAQLAELGLEPVRPWWRMDRLFEIELPRPEPVGGYGLLAGPQVATGVWSDTHNRSFADHWRYSPRGEEELMMLREPDLCLLAVDAAGRPAAITLGQIENYARDARPQPVGILSSVGTLPDHRRRGLARWMVTEMLARLRSAGARTASLYVDGLNPTGAPALYVSLGFEMAFETEVWEALFP